jgi:pyrimidine-nucleoside phosphorylase
MISGRGLGATGGTLDKLEAIPGFRTDLSVEEMQDVVERVGCVITGASSQLAPADKKLYALRDVSGTVPSIALITASIMSKKLAENPKALVLDVKWGSGAFMKSYDDAKLLAQSMVKTGRQLNVATTALLTDMNQPNGRMAGNANEVIESIDTLKGNGPLDLIEVTFALGAELLISTGKAKSVDDAKTIFRSHINSGRAFEKYEQMIIAQGGNPRAPMKVAPPTDVISDKSGYLTACDTERLGNSIIELGGGRKKQGDKLDHSTGLEILVRLGDKVERGESIVRVFAERNKAEGITEMVRGAFTIGDEKITPPQLIAEKI